MKMLYKIKKKQRDQEMNVIRRYKLYVVCVCWDLLFLEKPIIMAMPYKYIFNTHGFVFVIVKIHKNSMSIGCVRVKSSS